LKLACRTSSTWRSASPAASPGSSFTKASKSDGSKRWVGANCQTIGPSLCASSVMPLSTKRPIDTPASASTRRWVAKREAFSENMKSSGVSSRHFAKVAGLCEL